MAVVVKEELVVVGEAPPVVVEITSELIEFLIKTTIKHCKADEELLVRSVKNTKVEGSFSIIITRKDFFYFPNVPEPRQDCESVKLTKTSKNGAEFVEPDVPVSENENLKRSLEQTELNIAIDPFRIVVSGTTLKASFQVFGIEKYAITDVILFNGVWTVDEEILKMLKMLSSFGGYDICDGMTTEEAFPEGNSTVSYTLVTRSSPFLRYESSRCNYVTNAQINRSKCRGCLDLIQQRVKKRNYKTKNQEINPKNYTDASSKCTLRSLTPQAMKTRISEIQKDRTALKSRVRVLEQRLKKYESSGKNPKKKKLKKTDDSSDFSDFTDDEKFENEFNQIVNDSVLNDLEDIIGSDCSEAILND